MNISQLLDTIAVDLNDAEPGHVFTTWPVEQIIRYCKEGIQLAISERPDLFIKQRILKVTAGQSVLDTCDCSYIYKVIGQCRADGSLLHYLDRHNMITHSTTREWQGRKCLQDPRDYRVKEYDIDTQSNNITIFPPVPGGVTVYLLVECVVYPTIIEDDFEFPVSLYPAILQWVLFRAKSIDAEHNSEVRAAASMHAEMFTTLLQAEQMIEGEIKQENQSVKNNIRGDSESKYKRIPTRASL